MSWESSKLFWVWDKKRVNHYLKLKLTQELWFLEITLKDMKYQLCLKYKGKLISLQNLNPSFIDSTTNFRKTTVKDQSMPYTHDQVIKLQEESVVNASGKSEETFNAYRHYRNQRAWKKTGAMTNQ